MKILQVIQRPQLRGAEIFACQLSNHLLDQGHDVVVLTLYPGDGELPFKGTQIHLNRPISHRLFDFIGWKKFAEYINKYQPDVIQANASDTLKFCSSSKYLFKWKNKLVFRNANKMGDFIDSPLKHKLNKFYLKNLDYVISVSKECEKDFIKTFQFTENKIQTVTIGVEEKKIDALSPDLKEIYSKGPVIVHIGGFVPEKNHETLIRIFSCLLKSNQRLQLVLIGKGKLQETIRQEVQEKGLEENVHFLDYRNDILEILKRATLFVMPSLIEGLPAVILEAMYCGTPVVAFNVGGISEVIKSGQTGELVQKGDEDDFIQRVERILGDENYRDEIVQNASDLIHSQFLNNQIAEQFESCYENLLEPEIKRGQLRILQIIQKKQFRGAEIFCCQLSNELEQKGHEVQVYSIFEGSADLPYSKVINSFQRNQSLRYTDYSGWKAIAEIVRKFKPDIVQANASDTLKYTVISRQLFGWKVPIVFRNASLTSFYINGGLSKEINRFLFQKVDKIVSVSESSRNDLNGLFPFTTNKSIVITNGVNLGLQENKISSPFQNGKLNIVHVGSLTSEKNHLKLIRIFKRFLETFSEASLHIIGDGPLKKIIDHAIQNANLTDKVIMHGEMPNPQLYIKNASMLVLPSLVEGLPGVILEAMNFETPVVAYNVGGISEVLNDETGYLVESNNETQFVEAMKQVVISDNTNKILKAKELVISKFNNSLLAEKFVKVYRDTIAEKKFN